MSESSVGRVDATRPAPVGGDPPASLLALGLVPRLGLSMSLIAMLWLLVAWAL